MLSPVHPVFEICHYLVDKHIQQRALVLQPERRRQPREHFGWLDHLIANINTACTRTKININMKRLMWYDWMRKSCSLHASERRGSEILEKAEDRSWNLSRAHSQTQPPHYHTWSLGLWLTCALAGRSWWMQGRATRTRSGAERGAHPSTALTAALCCGGKVRKMLLSQPLRQHDTEKWYGRFTK